MASVFLFVLFAFSFSDYRKSRTQVRMALRIQVTPTSQLPTWIKAPVTMVKETAVHLRFLNLGPDEEEQARRKMHNPPL